MDNIVSAETTKREDIPLEERIFQLECHISMLESYVIQIVNELNKQGLKISDTLKPEDE